MTTAPMAARLLHPLGCAMVLASVAAVLTASDAVPQDRPAATRTAPSIAAEVTAPEPMPTTELAARPPAPPAAPGGIAPGGIAPGAVVAPLADDPGRRSRAMPAVTAARIRSAPRLGPETPQQRLARLLSSVRYDWRSLGFSIGLAGPRAGLLGLTEPDPRRITVFVRPGQSDRAVLDTIAHEIGHAVDLTHGTRARRAEYLRLRGLGAATPWWPCGSCSDYASGAGDFAEVFAVWTVGSQSFSSELAGHPSADRLRAVRHLFVPDPVVTAVKTAVATAVVVAEPALTAVAPRPVPTATPTPAPAPTPATVMPTPTRRWIWPTSAATSYGGGRRTRR